MTTLPKFMGGALTLPGCARKTEHLVPVNFGTTCLAGPPANGLSMTQMASPEVLTPPVKSTMW